MVRRIHVTYRLRLAPDEREKADRVLDFHADFCPVARSIRDSIQITTSMETEDVG